MDVLAVIHGEKARAGIFGAAVVERGHALDEWSLAWGTPPPRPLDSYGAVLVFGGSMHADQDDRHPWLREEHLLLQTLLDRGTPTLGVCLGAQLVAKAAHAPVGPAVTHEIGWVEVSLTREAEGDPLFSELPGRFDAFQWHFYTYGVPAGAEELARSRVCTQAFRLGDVVWGVQFHPEVTLGQIDSWLAEPERDAFVDVEALRAETVEKIEAWNDVGRGLCTRFVEVAETASSAQRAA
jgi:GMP synthase (glutamine-hydrolysing)